VAYVTHRSIPLQLVKLIRNLIASFVSTGVAVIRYRLKELIADQTFRLGRIVTMEEVARETGLHRMTLSRMANIRGYVTRTDILDKLCEYFGCRLEELAQHVQADQVPESGETNDDSSEQ
jgi:putative transcriptional regulator